MLLSFLGSSRTVYASGFTYTDVTQNITLTHNRSASCSFQEFLEVAPTRFNIEVNGTGDGSGTVTDFTSGNTNDIDFDTVYDLDGRIIFDTMNYRYGTYLVNYSSSYSLTGLDFYSCYSGHVDVAGTVNFTNSNSNLTVIGAVPIDIRANSTFHTDMFFSYQRNSYSAVSFKYTGAFVNAQRASGISPRIGINTTFLVLCRATVTNNNFDQTDGWFHSNVVAASDTVAVNSSSFYQHSTTELAYLSSISNYLADILVVDNLTYTQLQSIYSHVNDLETLLAANTSAINAAETNIASLLATANVTQAEIDSYLQLLYARNHDDIQSLITVNRQHLINLYNKIEAFRDQQETSDNLTRALITNRVQAILDALNYDDSTTSATISATQHDYDAAQGVADAAIDAAVHSYTSDLSTVEAYDYSSFFTRQRNSAVFWRDVGEYILDSSNLGFVSGSIIIVTLIGLVIFMLRL